MKTPHISLRVTEKDKERWQATCGGVGVSVSTQIRKLMNGWCEVEDERRSREELLSARDVDFDKLRIDYYATDTE